MTTTLLILARTLSFGSGMILVGVMAFRRLVLLPAFAGATDDLWKPLGPFGRQLHRLIVGSALILVLSDVLLFWAVTAEMSDNSPVEALNREALATVLFQTQFGTVCLWRIGFAVILCALLISLRRTFSHHPVCMLRFAPLELAAGMTAVALVISAAWTGHAAASSTMFLVRIVADAFHLLAAAIWPAGLLPFALFLKSAPTDSPPVSMAIRRFSALSLVVVIVLIVTGIINSVFLVGSFSALVTTEYGRILCLKLILFLVIMALACWNRFRLLPLLSHPSRTIVVRQLRCFVVLEFGLAVAIVVVVGFLGLTPPPG
jgi:putative copper resistance protein D